MTLGLLVAKFRSNIAHKPTLEWLVCLQVSKLTDERMRSLTLPIDNQLCHYDRMRRRATKGPDPPFRGREMRRVQDECLVVRIPSCSRFQTSNIGSVTQLRLRIASNDPEVFGLSKKLFVLLWSPLLSYRWLNKVSDQDPHQR